MKFKYLDLAIRVRASTGLLAACGRDPAALPRAPSASAGSSAITSPGLIGGTGATAGATGAVAKPISPTPTLPAPSTAGAAAITTAAPDTTGPNQLPCTGSSAPSADCQKCHAAMPMHDQSTVRPAAR
jgi:hypothetical protein